MPVWEAMRLNQAGESIVVVPSVDPDEPRRHRRDRRRRYEERFLFLLLLLRQPRLRLIYVTGRPIDPSARRLLPRLLPGVIPQPRARAGCTWSPRSDGSPRPLTAKLLQRPRVLDADPRR